MSTYLGSYLRTIPGEYKQLGKYYIDFELLPGSVAGQNYMNGRDCNLIRRWIERIPTLGLCKVFNSAYPCLDTGIHGRYGFGIKIRL